MRTYLILADKVRRFHEDPEIQEALRVAKVSELAEATAPAGGLDELLAGSLGRGGAGGTGLWPRTSGPTRHRAAARGPLVPLVVGVDSSTSACKVQVRDADTGHVVASGRAAHSPTSPPRSEQHPCEWEAAFHAACAEAAIPDRAGPLAISVAAQQHGLVVLGEDDAGPAARQALERHRVGARHRARSSPPSPVAKPVGRRRAGAFPSRASPSPSCIGCDRCEPETFGRIGRRAPPPRLAHVPAHRPAHHRPGRCVGHRVLVTARGALPRRPPAAGQRRRRLGLAALPEVLAPDAVAGEWRGAGIPVAAGTGDNMAAALGLGLRPGDLALSLGTSGDRLHGLGGRRQPTPPARWPASPTRPAAICRWSAP